MDIDLSGVTQNRKCGLSPERAECHFSYQLKKVT